MIDGLEDARKLAHGTYDDVIVAEHRGATGGATPAPHVVLELPERSRVIDKGQQFEIDGVLGQVPPALGVSYRLIVEPSNGSGSTHAASSTALRYQTMGR